MEAAVEVTTGRAGANAPTAAEWDDRGEHGYISLGCSRLLRHMLAAAAAAGRQAEVGKRLE